MSEFTNLRFYAKMENNTSKSLPLLASGRLIIIDAVVIDSHSPLTLTKKLRKVFPINPKDILLVFQDTDTKNIIFKVQRENDIVSNWIIKEQSPKGK
jgi:hypothetical protein